MLHYWWVPCVAAVYGFMAFLSKKNQQNPVDIFYRSKYFWAIAAMGWIPLWGIVSKYSRNMKFDALLYDFLMTSSFIVVLFFLEDGTKLQLCQVVGAILVVTGLVLIRIAG